MTGNNDMKIAFICEGIAGGGAERQTVILTSALSEEENNHVYLITGKKREEEYETDDRVERLCILKGSKKIVADAGIIAGCSKRHQFDVVIGMGIYANLCGVLSKLFGNKAKVVVCERNAPRYDYLSVPSRFLRKLLYWRADGFVFQTEEQKQCYSSGIRERSVIIHNPLKENIPYKSDVCKKEIVAVGRLMPQKNYPLLLNAFRLIQDRHPEYILRIFGTGTEEERLKNICRQTGIEGKVVFEGFCLDVHERIKDSDIYVLSSDFEGMPNALMEAMAMGFPAVATDCHGGGPKALIEDGVNGLLTPVGDAEGLAEKVICLIEDEGMKRHIARCALEIRETHSGQIIADRWEGYLRKI